MQKLSNEFSFGVICPPFTGHLNPMLSLALEIKNRGHRVTLFHYDISKDLSKINRLGIETISISTKSDVEFLLNELEILGSLTGWSANKQTGYIYQKLVEINFNSLPKKIKACKCNVLLIDQSLFEGESIASIVQLPFINICNALMLNPDINLPPMFMPWRPDSSIIGSLRNLLGHLYVGLKSTNPSKLVNKYREQKNLPLYPSIFNENYFAYIWSKVATITQQPTSFEFSRQDLTNNFYFTGPFINSTLRENISFPWEKLNDKPLIYISMGTLQNCVDKIFNKIVQACIGLDCQLVISLGKRNFTAQKIAMDKLPDNTIVVDYAPQLQLLEKARLCITHAGINTTLESLSNGVPMVAIPIANDQPGVGARIEWTGTGKVVKHTSEVAELKKVIKEVLSNNFYRQNAVKMQEKINSSNGVKYAADIIERAFTNHFEYE